MAEVSAAEIEQCSKNFLVNIVRNFKVFIDTCSLMSEHAEQFWEHIIPVLKEEKANIVVPLRVYEEVDKYASNAELCERKDPGNPRLYQTAKRAKEKVIKLQAEGLIRVLGDKNDNFADNVFLTIFTQYRMKYNLILITQDQNLAADILRIPESKAVKANTKILVRRINQYAYLSPFKNLSTDTRKTEVKKFNAQPQTRYSEKKSAETSSSIPEDEVFAYADTITATSGSVSVSLYPREGDTVTAERGGNRRSIKLIQAGPSGGEGTIYTTDIPNVVAKIYKPGKVDKAKFEKLRLMMTKNINCEGVCFPIAMLYNSKDEFVGFLMDKARGKELQKCLFIPQLLKKYFPEWKKKDTVQLCITILRKFKYLHDRNIILGDINPNNILVVSPNEVYFVDTDSYQIEGYPCPVGTINYTAPEIQRKKFDTFLRTMGNEQFAVATLLFMIMLPGKPPYSLQGGENQIDNIINGDFAYASGERTTGKAPEGVWRYIWSHLPRYLKDDFYETFRKGGLQSTEGTRFTDDDWIRKFEHYAELLSDEHGKFLTNDSMSAELFPNRLKKDANTTYIKCRLCGREVDEERTEQGYCRDCLRTGETYRCSRCGDDIVFTNYQKLIRRGRKYDICKACNDKLNSVYMRRNCSICGSPFDITFGAKEFYDNKGFDLPKRCPSCRNGKLPVYSESSDIPSHTHAAPAPAPAPKKSSLCFITTAVCKYFDKPDDCYELTALRKFRDTWLVAQPGGKELIEEYYVNAPCIVKEIDGSPKKDEIYIHIWNDYLEPCLKLIELGANDTCKKLYIDMVHELEARFC